MQGSALARRRVLGAKAIGEPPLMLAASVLSALQAAARAGRAELRAVGALPASVGEPLVRLPANPESMVAALGGSARDLAAVFSG
jgi:xanthine dehydrogenase molybdopterin-binding subunit B